MESKESMFQLDHAIHTWKEAQQTGHAMSSDALSELEAHLRDSVLSLEGKGLDQEEAFLIAKRRLGSPSELESEFDKVHQKQVWLSRALLILSGFLILSLLLKFIAVDQAIASIAALAIGLDSTQISLPGFGDAHKLHWSGIIHAVVGIVGLGIAALIILSFARGSWQNKANLLARKLGIGKLLAMWVTLYVLMSVLQIALNGFQVRILDPTIGEMANVSLSASLSNLTTQVLSVTMFVILTALLGKRYIQARA